MRGAKEDTGLAEVKAILTKLQRLDLAAHEDIDLANPKRPSAAKGRDHPEAAPGGPGINVFDRKHAAFGASDKQARPASKKADEAPRLADYRPIAGALAAAVAILIAAAVIVIYMPGSGKKSAAAVPTPT